MIGPFQIIFMFNKRQNANLRRKRPLEDVEQPPIETVLKTRPDQIPSRGITITENLPKPESAIEDSGPVTSYESDRRLVDSEQANKVFASLDVDTEKSQDHRSVLERNYAIGQKILAGELEEGIYRGKGAYRPHLQMREGAISGAKFTGLLGPLRGSQYARTTMRIDYNPEICKDYKETGYCGYGDTCKFLHDRSDYKSGWQIEKEWEEAQRKKQQKLIRAKLEGKTDGESLKSDSSSSDESN